MAVSSLCAWMAKPRLPKPFEEARTDVAAAWRAEAVVEALSTQAEAFVTEMANGADIITLGVNVLQETDIARGDFVPDVPASLVETVFGMAEGGVATVVGDATVVLVELDAINQADLTDGEAASLRGILTAQADQALSQEILAAFSAQIRQNADIEIDQNALNSVHAHIQ